MNPDRRQRGGRKCGHLQAEQFGCAQSASIGDVKHRPIAQSTIATAIGRCEKRPNLFDRQGIDEPRRGPLAGQRVDAQCLIEAGWNLVFDIAEEGSHRGETGVTGGNAVASLLLDMIQEGQDEIGAEIFDLKVDRSASSAVGREPDQ